VKKIVRAYEDEEKSPQTPPAAAGQAMKGGG